MVKRSFPRPNHFIYPLVLKPHHISPLLSPLLWCIHTCVNPGFITTSLSNLLSFTHTPPLFLTSLLQDCSTKCFTEMFSWTALFSGYVRSGDISHAIALFDEMPERDVPSWNAILIACTQTGLFVEAISLFRRMISEPHVRPNEVTLVCVLSACAQTGTLQLAKGIHAFAYRRALSTDMFVSNSLVDLFGKCGNLEEASSVFKIANKKGLTAAWNSMINCFSLHGRSEETIAVFEEMMKLNSNYVKPDRITLIGLLNACPHGGLVSKGRDYFDIMTNRFDIEPRIEHYGCLIDLLGS